MLNVYHGEFLVSPIPLELSLSRCGHGCRFCFAVLNSPSMRGNVGRIMNLLSSYQNRDSLEAVLLRAGMPVLMSNRTDPFSLPNYQQTLKLIETFTALDIPLAFQTRGGKGIDEALNLVGPSCWYVSINTQTEPLRESIEPHAPSLASRFALMETLVSRGHRVVLGLNPLVREWMPEPEAILSRALAAGCSGAWIERLHLSPKQVGNMSAADREVLTEPVITQAKKRRPPLAEFEFILDTTEKAMDLGLEVFSIGQPFYSRFFDAYREVYPNTFPVLQDWINHCFETEKDTAYTFAEFAEFMEPRLPAGILPIDSYLGATAHDLWHSREIATRMTYRQLLEIMWTEPKTKGCPARFPSFAYAGRDDGEGGWTQLVDHGGIPLMFFNPAGFAEWWAEAAA